MKAILIILIIILLIKFGWKTIKFLWKNPWQAIIILLIGAYACSDPVMDRYFSDCEYLKLHGYTQDREGAIQAAKDASKDLIKNRKQYSQEFFELLEEVSKDLLD